MNIPQYAVFGAKRNASLVKKRVNEYFTDKKISFFIENLNFNSIGSKSDGTPIISLYTMYDLYCQGKIKGVLIPSEQPLLAMKTMKSQLLEIGIPKKDIFAVPIVTFRKEILTDEEYEQIFTPYENFVQIYDLLFNITEYCNLKCRSCLVFSNLVQGQPIYEWDIFEQDLRRLRELVPGISSIGILGGEPFLNQDVTRYAASLRAAYPNAHITLTTNGILLPSLPQRTFEDLRAQNVTIHLSLYPPMKRKLDMLLGILRQKNMNFFVSDRNVFHKNYVCRPMFDKEESAARCTYTCFGLRNGRLSRCEHALYIEYLNKKFNTNLPLTAGIDIHDPSLSGEKLMRLLEEPLELCAWCASGLIKEQKPWRPSLGDDVVDDYFCFPL